LVDFVKKLYYRWNQQKIFRFFQNSDVFPSANVANVINAAAPPCGLGPRFRKKALLRNNFWSL
jgi:hypothetical protein